MLELKLVSGEQLKLVIEGARSEAERVDGRPERDAKPERDDAKIDLAHLAHFFAVQAMLRPQEALATSEIAAAFSATELRAWLLELAKLNVAQAVQRVRVLVAGNTEAVS